MVQPCPQPLGAAQLVKRQQRWEEEGQGQGGSYRYRRVFTAGTPRQSANPTLSSYSPCLMVDLLT